MLNVDQSGEGRFGAIVPLARCSFSAGILRGGDDLKILTLQLFVNFLPPGQIESASSPRGPGGDQNFLAAEIAEVDDLALAIRHREIGSDT
jgi:hypothetical protein